MSKSRRNAPCPCGSGRKYKHCCLGREPDEAVPFEPAPEAEDGSRLEELCRQALACLEQHDAPGVEEACAILKAEFPDDPIWMVALAPARFAEGRKREGADLLEEAARAFIRRYGLEGIRPAGELFSLACTVREFERLAPQVIAGDGPFPPEPEDAARWRAAVAC